MKNKDAKDLLRRGARYYLHERGVIGTHWEEWKAVEHALKKWERSDARLATVRKGLKDLLAQWKLDARSGRGASLGVADRINKLLKEIR